jgi:hypothetical protein
MKNIIITVPFFAIRISALWVELITGVPNSVAIALAEKMHQINRRFPMKS